MTKKKKKKSLVVSLHFKTNSLALTWKTQLVVDTVAISSFLQQQNPECVRPPLTFLGSWSPPQSQDLHLHQPRPIPMAELPILAVWFYHGCERTSAQQMLRKVCWKALEGPGRPWKALEGPGRLSPSR